MLIGSYQLENNLILAPMAGINGRPFQELCKQSGAGSALLRDETLVKKILEYVLDNTGADTIMIGRAAQGNPWLFNQIHDFLDRGKHVEKPTVPAIRSTIMSHLEQLTILLLWQCQRC
jgi:tRNA-dihydrouridine synthase